MPYTGDETIIDSRFRFARRLAMMNGYSSSFPPVIALASANKSPNLA